MSDNFGREIDVIYFDISSNVMEKQKLVVFLGNEFLSFFHSKIPY